MLEQLKSEIFPKYSLIVFLTNPNKCVCAQLCPAPGDPGRILEWVAGDLSDPGIELESPASPASADRFFTTEPPGKPSQ